MSRSELRQRDLRSGWLNPTEVTRHLGSARRVNNVEPCGAPHVRGAVGVIAAEQCRELQEFGIRQFHFYTMNQPELAASTFLILGLRRQGAEQTNPIETAV